MIHVLEEQLVAYALDDADRTTRGEVEAHVAVCGECRDALAELRRVLEAASELDVPARPADYGAAVWARLAPQLSDPAGVKPRFHVAARMAAWRPWLAAAAVLLLAIGAFLIGRWTRPSEAPVQTAIGPASPAATIRERVVLAALSRSSRPHGARAGRTRQRR